MRPVILVIDDEHDTLNLLKIALERADFRVFVAESWHRAASQIEYIHEMGYSVDAIVLDLMLPEHSGFDILKSLQNLFASLPPIIMLTAVTGFEQQITARELGVSRYLTKPTTPKNLIAAIRTELEKVGF